MVFSAQGNNRNGYVSALWKPSPGQHNAKRRIGHVQYIIRHSMPTLKGEMQHAIAVVHWFKTQDTYFKIGCSCYVQCMLCAVLLKEEAFATYQLRDCYQDVVLVV